MSFESGLHTVLGASVNTQLIWNSCVIIIASRWALMEHLNYGVVCTFDISAFHKVNLLVKIKTSECLSNGRPAWAGVLMNV